MRVNCHGGSTGAYLLRTLIFRFPQITEDFAFFADQWSLKAGYIPLLWLATSFVLKVLDYCGQSSGMSCSSWRGSTRCWIWRRFTQNGNQRFFSSLVKQMVQILVGQATLWNFLDNCLLHQPIISLRKELVCVCLDTCTAFVEKCHVFVSKRSGFDIAILHDASDC